MSWDYEMTPEEKVEWDRFVAHTREQTVKGIEESAMVMSLAPDEGNIDIKFAVELGLAIMLDKPLIVVAMAGRPVPDRLRQVADAVVEIDDMDTEAGQAQLREKLLPLMERYGVNAK